ncbi:MAG: BtrH N-terminal domain-containing protein [Campylobacterota bacterium]|nr:BtrH N-terminal domain-containing protein [Campylobacterota bacterium]
MSDFQHTHAAHCESGVMSSLLSHHGLKLSEAMVFGLSGAMVFAYLPFIKMGGMPLIAYRMMPKAIIKGLQKNIGVKMTMQTFSKPEEGTAALDVLLTEGKIVGAQAAIFWLPYFPEEMRFHFNAHNLIVYGREDQTYAISDPVFQHAVTADVKDLEKARFNKGVMAPKGLLYYPKFVPKEVDFETIIPKTIKKTAKMMLKTPVPVVGIRGMRYLARTIRKLDKRDRREAKLFLGHIVRMQEEVGTGGAGFRFVYASYLDEASTLLGNTKLFEASRMMTETGDLWREFALMIVKSIRSKKDESITYSMIADQLETIASAEGEVYQKLLKAF